MKKEQIAPQVFLTTLPNEKFKRNRLTINFILPNEKKNATMFAILPGLMERMYEDCPDMRLFSQKLNKMYSASLTATTGVIGQNRSIRFTIQGIKNEFCLKGEDLLLEMCDVLLGVIFRPCLEDGVFIERWLEVEKFKLKEEIEGEINDKRDYCIKNARRKFFGDDLNGVERLGYIDKVDEITPKALYDCYKMILDEALIEIYITANTPDTTKEKLSQAFSYTRSAKAKMLPIQAVACTDVQYFTEEMDTTQGKICLMYTTKRILNEDERYHMLVASALYGGTPSSRLFKNVREKQSLCYYCAAGFNSFTSSMSIDSGVEHENTQRTIQAVQEELKDLITGEIDPEEIEQTKLIIQNSLKSNYDGLHGLEAWYLNEALRGTHYTPEMVIELVNKVTKSDIQKVLGLLNLNVVYTISK
ncbi:MAG: insulinase family protein [Oscillospiraceae bacterium]